MRQEDFLRQISLKFTGSMADLKSAIKPRIRKKIRSVSQELLMSRGVTNDDLARRLYQLEGKLTSMIDDLIDQISTNTLNQIRTTLQPIVSEIIENQSHAKRLEEKFNVLENTESLIRYIEALKKRMIERQNHVKVLLSNKYPEFEVLEYIQNEGVTSVPSIKKEKKFSRGKIEKIISNLHKDGYVKIDKKGRRKRIVFLKAPWIAPEEENND
ncbi:MAG: hypothetical protein ACTSW4_06520 [Candidatus Ranarchaeia archaeon]